MAESGDLAQFLSGADVGAEVFALRPDYRAMLLAVDGFVAGPSNDHSEALMGAAEKAAVEAIGGARPEELPHVEAWREAYRTFGAKPQRTRNSLEALLRRVSGGLPRVNGLTDIYNAISVLHQVPVGGEDLASYVGAPRLVRATGDEVFATVVDGMDAFEHPAPGEVVWCDDEGVTCRRWNWRQGSRTQLTEETTSALFILDALAPMPDDALRAATDDLISQLERLGSDVRVAGRLLTGTAQQR